MKYRMIRLRRIDGDERINMTDEDFKKLPQMTDDLCRSMDKLIDCMEKSLKEEKAAEGEIQGYQRGGIAWES